MSCTHQKTKKEPNSEQTPSHFNGKEAIEHVVEAQVKGKIAATEIHGTEIPGALSAAADASRESALLILLVWALLAKLGISPRETLGMLAVLALGWVIWKSGRSAWLGWFRLERLHRVLAQEKWEIDHNRQQERDELRVLYASKGFEGKLLEDVLDVLMADGDRLLRVMVEEELGFTLEAYEHPLKQSLAACIGATLTFAFCLASYYVLPSWGILISSLVSIGCAGALTAIYARNRMIPSFVWTVGIAVFSFGTVYFLLDYLFYQR